MNCFYRSTLLVMVILILCACSKQILKVKEELIVEYGQPISINVQDYLNTKEIDKKDLTKLVDQTKLTIKNDKFVENKKYQAVGEYTVELVYGDEKAEVKVSVKDTTKPQFLNFKDKVDTYKDVKVDFTKMTFDLDDLSGETTSSVDDSKVDYKKVGTYKAIVTAKDKYENTETKELTVNVKNPEIKLDKTSQSVYVKESFVLKPTIKGKDTKATFKSSNNSVASVSDSGKVSAKKKGTTTITAEANGVKATCKVSVKTLPSGSQATTQTANTPTTVTDVPSSKPQEEKPVQPYVASLKAANRYSKIMVVSTNSTSSRKGTFEYFKKSQGVWKKVISTSAQLGKLGINKTREGDKKTPSGLFTFTRLMGIAANPGVKMSYHRIDDNDYWCGETYYNQLVDEDKQEHICSKTKDEYLMDYKGPYQYVAVLNYNTSNTVGKGSGIFLHCLTNTGHTLGCVGISKSHMRTVMRDIDSSTCIIIDTNSRIKNY